MESIFNEKIELANKLKLTKFMFKFQREYFFSELIKNKWSEPKENNTINHLKK